MRVRRLAVDGFKGLPDREYRLIDDRTGSAARIVAVTGPAASGKTSFLEAIIANKESIGPYGAVPATSDVLRRDSEAAKVIVEWELSGNEREKYAVTTPSITSEAIFGDLVARGAPPEPALAALLADYDPEPTTGKVEYFHATRRLPVGAGIDLSRSAGDSLDRVSRLARDDAKYGMLVRYIVEAGLGIDQSADGKPRPPGRIKQAFESLCGTKKLAGLYRAGGVVLPGFTDAQGRYTYGLGELSDSELDLLLFAASFVRAGLVGNTASCLVLVDTPEKHVGEKDAGPFVRGLSMLGPENQIVVATRSPSVAAEAQQVIQLT